MNKLNIGEMPIEQAHSGIEKFVYRLIVLLVFLLPLFFIPSPYTTFDFSKGILISVGAVLALCLWIVARLKDNKLIFSKNPLLISALVLVLVYLLAAIFSPAPLVSLIGNGFEFGTFGSIFSLVSLMCIVGYLTRSKDKIFSIYGALLISFVILAVFHITRFFIGANFLSFGYFSDITYNTIGKWNDIAVFFGMVAIMVLLTIELIQIKKAVKILLSLLLLIALGILAVVNFQFVWILMGVFSLVFFVYMIAFSPSEEKINVPESGPIETKLIPKVLNTKKLPWVSLLVLIISLVFILGGQAISNPIVKKLNISQLDVRPSWSATLSIATDALKEHPIFGVGPNRFIDAWLQHKPTEINQTQFWGLEFNYGIGFVPTAIVTTGGIGILAWLFFLIAFLVTGYKAITTLTKDQFKKYLTVSTFLVSLYLWVVLIFYVPSQAMMAITFIFTGLFIGAASLQDSIKIKAITFVDRPKISFVYVLFLVLILLGTLSLGYVFAQKFVSSIYFQKGAIELNLGKNVDNAEAALRQASLLSSVDSYSRSLTQIDLLRLSQLANNKNLAKAELQAEFSKIINLAETDATNAVKIDSTNYQNWVSLGQVYEAVLPLNAPNAYENAKVVYLEAIKRNPKNPTLYLLLARLEAFKGNIAEARVDVEKSLEIKPDYQDALDMQTQLKSKNPTQSITPTSEGK